MVEWSDAQFRLTVLKGVRDHGKQWAQAQFGVSNAQIENFKEQAAELIATIKKGRQLDGLRNSKRKGPQGKANERKAKKRKRIGEILKQNKRPPQYVYLDQRVLEWFTSARAAKFIVTPRMLKKFAQNTCKLEKGEEIRNTNGWYTTSDQILIAHVTFYI